MSVENHASPRGCDVSRAYVDRAATARCLQCTWTDYTSDALDRATDHIRATAHIVDGSDHSRFFLALEVTA
jgi:hypothetical protein